MLYLPGFLKRCNKCGEFKFATREYFPRHKTRSDGLDGRCKICNTRSACIYQENHREERHAYSKQWREKNASQIKEHKREYAQNNREKIREYRRIWRENHRKEINAYFREYSRNHREERRDTNVRHWKKNLDINRKRARDKAKAWRKANPEKAKERDRRNYQQKNPEKVREWGRKWRKSNPEKRRAQKQRYYIKHKSACVARALHNTRRRRARKRDLPDTFTFTNWQQALDYFGGCCAVCGRPPGLWHTIAADHWIPLANPNCPGTVPENIVPLCHGIDGCNNSKKDNQPIEWLTAKYSKQKVAKILKRIGAYFSWVKSQR